MARTKAAQKSTPILPEAMRKSLAATAGRALGAALIVLALALLATVLSASPEDPSLNSATGEGAANWLGTPGAVAADLLIQTLGRAAALVLALPLAAWGWRLAARRGLPRLWLHLVLLPVLLSATAMAEATVTESGLLGTRLLGAFDSLSFSLFAYYLPPPVGTLLFAAIALGTLPLVAGLEGAEWAALRIAVSGLLARLVGSVASLLWRLAGRSRRGDGTQLRKSKRGKARRLEPVVAGDAGRRRIEGPKSARQGRRDSRERQQNLDFGEASSFRLPTLDLLARPKGKSGAGHLSREALEQNAELLESVLDDFGIRGEICGVRPGPVVTLYELEPAPGTKSSRVIGLADDIARSMSAVSARVAVVPGRNAIGIELPNSQRETVFLRELLSSSTYEKSGADLALALGKDIGGAPVIADLANMPHLLVAGTTGSGKSVGLNTMILSLLYRLPPDRCKFIMVDPKMLELSVYEGIPHLLTPVVTEPKKAVVALKWAVREMEERYRAMSKLGVRNVTTYNKRVGEARANGETITRRIQTGFDRESGQPVYENQEFDLEPFPLIVIVIDEMADLMLVAGKDVEAMVQRLSQMARAAGLHLIMATQRPSVDVITGTIKANFPSRISYQVTSKIDSRTILGDQGAEQLLGQGDLLYMVAGGRITRVHGPYVSDHEVEKVVAMLKRQGAPHYLADITEEPEGEDDPFGFGDGSGNELYDKAVDIVLRDRKASTSYIQRRLKIGYNRAATLIEEMEDNGVISAPNHAGRREVLAPGIDD